MMEKVFEKMKIFRRTAVLLAVVLLFCGCGSGKTPETISGSPDVSSASAESGAVVAESGAEGEEQAQEKISVPAVPVPTETPPAATPETTPEAAPQAVPTEVPETVPAAGGWKVAIDAGHQSHGNSDQEPVGPGAAGTKAKVSSGTHGDASGLSEYELNLEVSLQLRDELTARGYEVCMIRETNDVDISNRERAELAAASGADILVRIHANGSEDPSVSGTLTMAPSADNPYVGDLAPACQELSRDILDAFCASTGAESQGLYITDDMSGINWSTIPVTIVEMGYMTNAEEDLKMASPEYQQLMVRGIANGIDTYFAGQEIG